jgi:hypothetical protein
MGTCYGIDLRVHAQGNRPSFRSSFDGWDCNNVYKKLREFLFWDIVNITLRVSNNCHTVVPFQKKFLAIFAIYTMICFESTGERESM